MIAPLLFFFKSMQLGSYIKLEGWRNRQNHCVSGMSLSQGGGRESQPLYFLYPIYNIGHPNDLRTKGRYMKQENR